jgi:upstream activation factor subunit UAF30
METSTNELLATLQAEIKALRKDLRKVKQLLEDPSGEKSKARASNNGFNKPLDVSDKLRLFLRLGADEKVSRSQVTKLINQYVTEKNLKNGQQITLDGTLRDLLNPPEGTTVTFLNIQKFINPHYIKPAAEPKTPKATPAAAPASSEAPGAPKKAARPTLKKTPSAPAK